MLVFVGFATVRQEYCATFKSLQLHARVHFAHIPAAPQARKSPSDGTLPIQSMGERSTHCGHLIF